MRVAEPVSTLVSTAAGLSTMTSQVDPEGARRMMEMLVNLYADRRLAVVREYVSNAVDATRVAGGSEPVLVTTPSLIEPNFVVTDRGTGMSVAEVEATFLAFAASSKRDSNDMIGGLGVGAKSAWALAESFLVDTVKAGKRTTVRAARNLEHQVLVAGAPTDLPDGTTIIVPVEVAGQADVWRRVVNEVACAHDRGMVLVDGAPVESLAGGPTWIGPVSCRRVDRPDRPTVVVRSGGTLFSSVPEVTRRVIEATSLLACVIELPIGSFDHTPSRESVIGSDRTLAAVDAALRQFKMEYDALAQRIATLALTDVAAAASLRDDTLATVTRAGLLPIPFRVGVPSGSGSWSVQSRSGHTRWERVGGLRGDSFEAVEALAELKRTVVVTGIPSGRVLSRFATFLADKHPGVRRVIAVPEACATLALEVFDARGQKTDQRWHIGPKTKGIAAHYSFAQWSAALAARRGTRAAVQGYDCVIVDRDAAASRSAVLSGPEIAALGLPVVYTADAPPSWSASGQPASVMVYLGRRKPGPLLDVVPSALSLADWRDRRFTAATTGWSPTKLMAAVYLTHWQGEHIKPAFDVAVAALAVSPAEHPRSELLTQVAEVAQAAKAITAAQAATLRELHGCASAETQIGKIRTLSNALVQAYPLLHHLHRWAEAGVREHYVRYLAHTPPAAAARAA